MSKWYIIPTAALVMALLSGCTKDKTAPKPEVDCNDFPHSFSQDVQPIFETNCALSDCHSSAQDEGQFALNTYDDAVFAAGFEEFLLAINHEPGADPMPDGEPKLPQAQINTIECWVAAGMPND